MPHVKSLLFDDPFAGYRRGVGGMGVLSSIYVVLIAFLVYQLDTAKGVLADVCVISLWTLIILYATCLVFAAMSLSDIIPKVIAMLTVTAPALVLLGLAYPLSSSKDHQEMALALLGLLVLILVTATIAAIIRRTIDQRVLTTPELPNAQSWEGFAYFVPISIAILIGLVLPEKHSVVYLLVGIGLSLPGLLVMLALQWSSELAVWMKVFLTVVFLILGFWILQEAGDIKSVLVRFPVHVMCYLFAGVSFWFLIDLPTRWLEHYGWQWMLCAPQSDKRLDGLLLDQNS